MLYATTKVIPFHRNFHRVGGAPLILFTVSQPKEVNKVPKKMSVLFLSLLNCRFLTSDGQSLKLKPWKGSISSLEQNGLPNGCEEDITEPFFTERTPMGSPGLQRQQSLVTLTGEDGVKHPQTHCPT